MLKLLQLRIQLSSATHAKVLYDNMLETRKNVGGPGWEIPAPRPQICPAAQTIFHSILPDNQQIVYDRRCSYYLNPQSIIIDSGKISLPESMESILYIV